MTEDEAKTKWCPHARVVVDGRDVFPTGNRFQNASQIESQALCIGSACMAWREITECGREEHNYTNRFSTGHGYCGLAGKP